MHSTADRCHDDAQLPIADQYCVAVRSAKMLWIIIYVSMLSLAGGALVSVNHTRAL